jgi:VanZ family protein
MAMAWAEGWANAAGYYLARSRKLRAMTDRHRRLFFFRVALVAAVALVFHLATTERAYPGVEQLHDKVSHVLAFATLAFLADFSFPASRFGPGKILPLLAYGVLIELVQYFLPYREASWLDVVGDGAGIAVYAIGFPVLANVRGLHRLQELRRSE